MLRFPSPVVLLFLLCAGFLIVADPPSAAQVAALATKQHCGETSRCPVETGGYLVHVPKSWDGKSPLPTVMFFHGYQESAESVMTDTSIVKFADTNGLMLVAPHGKGETWSYPGSPARNRDEFAFVKAVIADLDSRYPVDHTRFWASGFSQGGSMVWYIACEMGDRFTAYAPISGDFWLPQPKECKSGPINLRHIHGTSDTTVPMEGRAIGSSWRQGNLKDGLKVLRATDGCKETPDTMSVEDSMHCDNWLSCSRGRELRVCLHPGGHALETRFLQDSWDWVKTLKR